MNSSIADPPLCVLTVVTLLTATAAARPADDALAATENDPPGHKEVVRDAPVWPVPPPPPGAGRGARSTWVRGPYTSVQVNINAAGNNIPGDAANEPSMAIDPTNPSRIAIGWRQFDTVGSDFRKGGWAYSHNGGTSWTFPGVLEPTIFSSDPVLAADADGTFYYYSLQPDRGSAPWSCYLYKSFDGGVTWGQDVYARGGDKAWMTIDRTGGIGHGNIYMAWNIAFTCCPNGDFARSTDAGQSVPYPVRMPSNLHWGTIDVGPDGEVYVAGESFWVARSTNAQNSGETPAFDFVRFVNLGGTIGFGGGPNPAGLLGQAWVATDHSNGPNRGNVYLLCSVNPSGSDPLDVMFSRSTNGGNSWSAPVRVNDDSPFNGAWQWFGTMSVAPSGRIDVIWNDTRNDASATFSEVFYSFSEDAGQTWSPNVPISPAFNHFLGYPSQNKLGDYYHMISDDLGASLAYAATFNGEQDVYFVRIGTNDCNGNGVDDQDDIAAGTSNDCDANALPDECQPPTDCNTNAIQDFCDIAAGTSLDCTANGTPDECDPDCNANGIADSCDIGAATSSDCNANAIPDDCDIVLEDCNANGIPDDCDAAVLDCNSNSVPDDCDVMIRDCNANLIPDDCDIALGQSADCGANGVPDECEPDCDADGMTNSCAIANGLAQDCNGNGVPDSCDISTGTSSDTNANGIADECDFQICDDVWVGFDGGPPFTINAGVHGVDSDGDGFAWDNPASTTIVFPAGCQAGDIDDNAVKLLADESLADSTDGYVSSEYFRSVGGGLGCGAAVQSVQFGPKIDFGIDSRWDWQVILFDAVADSAVIQIEFASTVSNRVAPGLGGRILVKNPNGLPVHLDSGVTIAEAVCYDMEIRLDNQQGTVSLWVDGVLRLTTTPQVPGARRLDYFLAQPVEHTAWNPRSSRLSLDGFRFCVTGAALMNWPDCDGNCTDDLRDIADGIALDCNGNGVPDACDIAGGLAGDCNLSGVPDLCEGVGFGDLDVDGDADLADFERLQGCITGPGGGLGVACTPADGDCDGDVDLADFRRLQTQIGR